jgi:hypothetical protein
MKTTLLSIFAIAISFHLSNAQSQGKVYEMFNDAVVNIFVFQTAAFRLDL